MKFLGLSLIAIALLATTGCYWGYYHHGGYPYYAHTYSRPAYSTGYYSVFDPPNTYVTYYAPRYEPYYYGYYPRQYPRTYHDYSYYPTHYYEPRYYPTRYYEPRYNPSDRHVRDRRPSSSRGGSFLQKLRTPAPPPASPSPAPESDSRSFLRKFR